MSADADGRTPYDVIAHEKKAYLEEIPEPDSDWPPDVRAVYGQVRGRLFELGLEVRAVVEACGIGDPNVRARFHHFTGQGIKELILDHRLKLAKRLLRYRQIPITKIAFTVGYQPPSGLSLLFKRREECPPSEYRQRKEG